MITEKDLQEAIAECKGVKNPNASTCIKLAAFLTIHKELYGKEPKGDNVQSYSFDNAAKEETVQYSSDTEFANAIRGRMSGDIWPIMDELMSTLYAVNPRLYAAVIREIKA